MTQALFRLGSAKQPKAWEWFEEWLHRLSSKFSGETADIPLVLLAEWFGENEPMETTVTRCVKYRNETQ